MATFLSFLMCIRTLQSVHEKRELLKRCTGSTAFTLKKQRSKDALFIAIFAGKAPMGEVPVSSWILREIFWHVQIFSKENSHFLRIRSFFQEMPVEK
jgi:transposase